jgi:hypothetical protein
MWERERQGENYTLNVILFCTDFVQLHISHLEAAKECPTEQPSSGDSSQSVDAGLRTPEK